jgi:hypothetical protein
MTIDKALMEEARWGAASSSNLLNAQGLVEIMTESLDCSDDGGGVRVCILVTSCP